MGKREREREGGNLITEERCLYKVCVYKKKGGENKKKSGGFPFIFNRVVG
jgi:hypothetical protein